MPSTINPQVAAATIALKRSQTRLTHLKRKHLEGDYIAKDKVEAFVVQLATDFRQSVLELPLLIRQGLPVDFQKMNRLEVEDTVEAICDNWLLKFSTQELELPKPERPKGAYCTKPGPRSKREKLEAAE
jgi:hypothetical protein